MNPSAKFRCTFGRSFLSRIRLVGCGADRTASSYTHPKLAVLSSLREKKTHGKRRWLSRRVFGDGMPRQVCAGLALLLVMASTVARADEPLLAAGDRIRVDVFGRPDLSIEQDVQPSGAVRLPLIGEVAAAGLSPGAIEKAIADILETGIEVSPSVLVTAVHWRPVYVLGDVRNPRSVEYTADLTVLKAITLAGGFGPPGGGELTWVDAIRSRERLDTAYARYDQLQLRKARLLAERDGLDEIKLPSPTGGTNDLGELVDTERRLLQARKSDLNARLSSLDRLAVTYQDELKALETQRASLDEELQIASADVDASRTLSAQGLELRSRNSIIQRSRLDVVSRLAENASFVSRATANLQEARQSRASAPIEQVQDVLKELAEVQTEFRNTEVVILSESRILGESRRLEFHGRSGQKRRPQTSIEIVRGDHRFVAAETTALNPGDVVEITMDALSEATAGGGEPQSSVTPATPE